MPSPLVNRYAIYFQLPDQGKVPQSIAREPSLLMAVENCLNPYQATGHTGFVIDDTRAHRVLHVEPAVLLQLLFLRHQDRTHHREHSRPVGPRGAAEWMMDRVLASWLQGAGYFERLLTGFTLPAELSGPASTSALKQARFSRIPRGDLPEGHFGFLDALCKAH